VIWMGAIGGAIGFLYCLICMPLAALLAVILPVSAISNGKDVIANGYSLPGTSGGSLDVAWVLCSLLYVSLRFKSTRRFYALFPSMYQILKMFTISGLFTAFAMTVVNVAFKEVNGTRRLIGSVSFVAILVLWRVFMSVYYTRYPVVPFMEKRQERLRRVAPLE